jgi:predicted permease
MSIYNIYNTVYVCRFIDKDKILDRVRVLELKLLNEPITDHVIRKTSSPMYTAV